MGWLTGWSYRKEVTLVEQSSAAYNDLPTIITATFDAHMKTDFADCRFTESDGATLIAYGIKTKTDEVECEFVIKRSYTSGASLTVYLYYGNAAASDASVDYTTWADDWYTNNGFGKNPSAHHGSGDCAFYDHSETDDIPSWPEHVFGGCTANGGYRSFYGHVKINGTGAKWASTALCLGIANAYSLRWAKFNCSDSMYDHPSFVKGASNTVQWGHYSGGNTGFWVSWYPAEPSVSFGAEEEPHDEVELLAKFDVGQGTLELYSEFVVNQWFEDLLGEFTVNQSSADLLGNAEIQNSESAELLCQFEAQGIADLLGNIEVQGSASAELLGKFEAQDVADLLGEAVIKNIGSADLLGNVEVQQSGSAELLCQFEAQAVADLLGKVDVRQSGSAELLGNVDVNKGSSADLLGKFEAQGVADLLGNFEVNKPGSVELLSKTEIQQSGSAELLGNVEVRQSGSAELLSTLRVSCPRFLGENWQRKMWFDGTYYWRGRYDSIGEELIFEYIASAGLAGNTWTKNEAASISGLLPGCILADFSVRGGENGIPTTIHYSDGFDSYVAESDESSATGWAWQNNTKVFDATTTDCYRRVNLAANRTTPTPRLWVIAVFDDDSEGKQWVKARRQTTGGVITGWDTEVDISDVDNLDIIFGCSVRSMGDAGVEKNDIMVVYKEGAALRSRYYTGSWQTIQDIDTDTLSGHSGFDLEHGDIAGMNMGHLLYLDADNSVQWREREYGGASLWSAASELHAADVGHHSVGIIEHGSGWLWAAWEEGDLIEYRSHDCNPETWYPPLASDPLTFDVSTEAVVDTSTTAQLQTPDSVPSGEAAPICWIGETAPTTPCDVGWGILVEYSIASLKGVFNVRQPSSVELLGKFEVGQDSTDLLARFEAQGVADLLAKFEAQDTAELPGEVDIRQLDSAELLGRFEAQAIADLLANVEVQQSGSAELLGRFEAQDTADLLCNVTIRNSDSADLLGKADIGQDSAELLSKFEAQGIADLLGKFEAQGIADLLAKFEAQVTAELLAKFDVGQDSQDLLGRFEAQGVVDLLGKFEAQDTADLLARFEAQGVADLLAKFEAQVTADLLGKFDVGQDSQDLLGRFEAQAIADLLGKFDVGQDSQDLLGKFEAQAIADLFGKFKVQGVADLLANVEIQQSGPAELLGNFEVQQLEGLDLISNFYVSPLYLTADEMLIGGRDRRMDLGGLDREMVVGGRDRRMKIK